MPRPLSLRPLVWTKPTRWNLHTTPSQGKCGIPWMEMAFVPIPWASLVVPMLCICPGLWMCLEISSCLLINQIKSICPIVLVQSESYWLLVSLLLRNLRIRYWSNNQKISLGWVHVSITWYIRIRYLYSLIKWFPSCGEILGSETYPNISFGWVHIKDVADAHVLAFETPSANGRYLLVESVAHFSEVVKILHELYPNLKLPNK